MTEVEALIESLWELDEDELEAHIGSRAQAIGDDVAGRGTKGIDPASLESIDLDVGAKAPIEPRLLEAGGRLFERVNPLVYELMCKPLGGNDLETQKILNVPPPYDSQTKDKLAVLKIFPTDDDTTRLQNQQFRNELNLSAKLGRKFAS